MIMKIYQSESVVNSFENLPFGFWKEAGVNDVDAVYRRGVVAQGYLIFSEVADATNVHVDGEGYTDGHGIYWGINVGVGCGIFLIDDSRDRVIGN